MLDRVLRGMVRSIVRRSLGHTGALPWLYFEGIAEAFAALGAVPTASADAIIGRVGGLDVHYGLDHAPSVTRITVGIAEPLPGIDLDLRPETEHERSAVREGLAIDVLLGDSAFDAAFVVEGAPSARVRWFLDATTRRRLLGLRLRRLRVAGRQLELESGRFVVQPTDARALIHFTVGLSAQLTFLAAQSEQRNLSRALGATAGYRGLPPDATTALARAMTPEEISELEALRSVRKIRRARPRWVEPFSPR
jgi:hypothetical protein